MKNILVIMISRGVGGLERRTAFFYKNSISKNKECKIYFLVNRAQIHLIDYYQDSSENNNNVLIPFGLPYFKLINNPKKFYYYIDYFFLAIKLLLIAYRIKKFDLTYFTKLSSVSFHRLIRSDRVVLAAVDSHDTDRYTNSKLLRHALDKSVILDCLSTSIRNYILNEPAMLKYSTQIFSAPCSFTDYSQTKIDRKENALCFVGRLAPGKGLDLLIDALPMVLQKHSNTHVWIIGDGPLKSKVKTFLDSTGCTSYKVGFSSDPLYYLRKSLIFVSLQEKENYPSQSLMEAMACGNAIVATNVGDTSKLVDENIGILVAPNPVQIAMAINSMLDDTEKTKNFGIKARERVMNYHSIDKYIDYIKYTFLKDK